MKKTANITYKSDIHKQFANIYRNLAERHGRHQVWSDFITMSACSISNAVDKRFWDKREALYLDSAKRYSKEELESIAEMFAMTVMALEDNPKQDFLGEIFLALQLHNEWKGQFFTPYHIGSFMAAIQFVDAQTELKKREVISVNDCCCGAGCLLIAFANEAKKNGIDFQNRVLFVAQDIDFITALMCYIQLSLLGCRAVVKVGNSLTDPFLPEDFDGEDVWLSPMYIHGDILKWTSAIDIFVNEEENHEDGSKEEKASSEVTVKDSEKVEGKVSA